MICKPDSSIKPSDWFYMQVCNRYYHLQFPSSPLDVSKRHRMDLIGLAGFHLRWLVVGLPVPYAPWSCFLSIPTGIFCFTTNSFWSTSSSSTPPPAGGVGGGGWWDAASAALDRTRTNGVTVVAWRQSPTHSNIKPPPVHILHKSTWRLPNGTFCRAGSRNEMRPERQNLKLWRVERGISTESFSLEFRHWRREAAVLLKCERWVGRKRRQGFAVSPLS